VTRDEHEPVPPDVCEQATDALLLSRRQFLLGASATAAVITLPGWLRLPGGAAQLPVLIAEYPRVRIGSLGALQVGVPVTFDYPWDDPQARNVLIKLGSRAGGGVGPDEDVVAFNTFCTHMGGPLAEVFKAELGMVGPCPLHWTTFDLNRHGMVVSGHATQGLPQILLETDGDDIYAVGVMGLIFGYHDNKADPTALRG